MKTENSTQNCSHTYSRSITEPRPRLCTKCKEPEICKACHGEDALHMCGKKEGLNNTKRVYTELDMQYAISHAVAHPKITADEMKRRVEETMKFIKSSK